MRWNYSRSRMNWNSNEWCVSCPLNKFTENSIRNTPPMRFQLGQIVTYIDKTNPSIQPQSGVVVGTDPQPPDKTKRKGPCYVISPGTGHDWIWREESELEETST